ncbi:MAG: hypothetical protein ABL891_14695 [Burkholderiales bacterium]
MMIDRTQRRLIVALGVSLALHAWVMQSHYGKGAARVSAGTAIVAIAARMLPPAVETNIPAVGVPAPELTESRAAAAADFQTTPTLSMVTGSVTPASATTPAATAAIALSQPSDPNYYTVGDLDVFPKALVKPDLSAALGVTHEPAAGKVRAVVLIDEAGVVNAVRNVEAQTNDIETIARELLLRTRFTPARNKEGRIVKAQVLVALEYHTRDARAAPAAR